MFLQSTCWMCKAYIKYRLLLNGTAWSDQSSVESRLTGLEQATEAYRFSFQVLTYKKKNILWLKCVFQWLTPNYFTEICVPDNSELAISMSTDWLIGLSGNSQRAHFKPAWKSWTIITLPTSVLLLIFFFFSNDAKHLNVSVSSVRSARSLNSNLSKHWETGHLTVCLSVCLAGCSFLPRPLSHLWHNGGLRGSICACLWFDLCKYWSPLRPVSSSCRHTSAAEIKYRGEEEMSLGRRSRTAACRRLQMRNTDADVPWINWTTEDWRKKCGYVYTYKSKKKK